jgi:fructose transport system substrate-binding protein
MREGAEAAAAEHNMTVNSYAGQYDGDHEAQVAAVETCIANGVSGILLVPSDSSAMVSAVQQARDAGILVITLDTPLNPIDAADATLATDNFRAGELIGQWAAATLGDEAANAKIAFLDLDVGQPTVDVLRNQGFMTGFGIDTKDPNVIGDEDDPRIAGHDVTQGAEEGGRTAMENILAANPDVNVVYAINEPAAAGGYQALQAMGMENDVLIVAVDGGCLASERQGRRIGATPSSIRSTWLDWASRRSPPSPPTAPCPRTPRVRTSTTPACGSLLTRLSRASSRSRSRKGWSFAGAESLLEADWRGRLASQ